MQCLSEFYEVRLNIASMAPEKVQKDKAKVNEQIKRVNWARKEFRDKNPQLAHELPENEDLLYFRIEP